MKILQTLTAIFFCIIIFSCNKERSLFQMVPSHQSGILFNNKIIENDSVNPFDVTNIYNGGGIGIGDFNNDGLADIYFAGNQVASSLYLNKRNFRFDDITETAKVEGKGRWCRGVAVVDINNDGWQDLYVCTTILADKNQRENLLYVNQGLNKDGIPVFNEMGKEYGLNDDSHSTMASFFDYDNDGDLDVYITVNEIVQYDNPSVYRSIVTDGSSPSTGRLYNNEWNTDLKHPFFINVTKKAGVTIEGYGHSASIADFNRDGWKDIYVANDFLSNDLLYINNHDGTFTNKASEYFKHTSANGMGMDVIDINNDGLSDVVEMDMDPEDNYRKKLLMSGYNYQNYHNNNLYGYQYQYVRNTLQLNQGPRVLSNDSIGDPVFSDVSFFAGISSTDWSWAPVVQDFDNDGYRDIIVTNGFPKDLTDHDFIAFREKSFAYASKSEVLSKIPIVKIKNYGFHNNGDASFTDVTDNWGLTAPSFSNGAAYADLDNDGDMDMVINNINDEAFIYRNTLIDGDEKISHFLGVTLKGDSLNKNGLGTWIEVYYKGKMQVIEQMPYRGYLSSMQIEPHFGLGETTQIDSLVVKWPGNKKQVISNVLADQVIVVDSKNASMVYDWQQPAVAENSIFKDITDSVGIYYQHAETDFIDFNIQRLLPHKLSEYNPALAVGDINNDGLDDIVAGGSLSYSTTLFLQQKDGKFLQKSLLPQPYSKTWEDMGIALFDADSDGDLDIYIGSGGNENKPYSNAYEDKFYINDGHGDFKIITSTLQLNLTSKSCVRPADFDNDGDLDLFIGGRVYPWNYPKVVSSAVYRNDSKNGIIEFTDVTASVVPSLINVGMICDANWSDFDNDGWQDLVLAGEWSHVRLLKNYQGKFKDISKASGLSNNTGWWNSVASGDFDNDGDIDYVVGNLGKNSFYKASDQYPVSIYAKDFYKQGSTQCIVTGFLKAKEGGELKEFTIHTRDDVIEQLPFIKKRFLTYSEFGKATFDKLFTAEELNNSTKYTANYFNSSLMINNGNGKFFMEPLPDVAQYSALNGMVVDDFDGDGNLDVCINTNDFGTDPSNGRYDALNGLILKGDGKGKFNTLNILQSGIFIPGNGKALVKIRGSKGEYLLAASQNRGSLKIFRLKSGSKTTPLRSSDINAMIFYKDGRSQIREVGYGNSFLSQSSRFLNTDSSIKRIKIKNNRGETREMGN